MTGQLRKKVLGFPAALRDELTREFRCWQCGQLTSWTAGVCPACGTADPVRLPKEWLAYAATLLLTAGVVTAVSLL